MTMKKTKITIIKRGEFKHQKAFSGPKMDNFNSSDEELVECDMVNGKMDLQLPERQNRCTVMKSLQKDFKASNGLAVRSTPCSGLAVHCTVCSRECFQKTAVKN